MSKIDHNSLLQIIECILLFFPQENLTAVIMAPVQGTATPLCVSVRQDSRETTVLNTSVPEILTCAIAMVGKCVLDIIKQFWHEFNTKEMLSILNFKRKL